MFNTVLLDLDGTLTDSGPGILNSIRYSLKKMEIEIPSDEILKKFIGPPLGESYRVFIGLDHEKSLYAVECYREYYREKGIYENSLYPGVKEFLEYLSQKEIRIYLATSKPQVFAEQILKYFDIYEYFEGVIGSNIDGTRTDKSEIISVALDIAKVDDKDKVLMVGDRKHDVIGAHKNDIRCAGVLIGYGSREELMEEDADYIFDDLMGMRGIFA